MIMLVHRIYLLYVFINRRSKFRTIIIIEKQTSINVHTHVAMLMNFILSFSYSC